MLEPATIRPAGSRRRAGGFSLVELLVVVAIIGILGAIAYPSYQDYVRESRRTDAYGALLTMANEQEKFYLSNNSYTTTLANVWDQGTTSLEDFYTLSVPTGMQLNRWCASGLEAVAMAHAKIQTGMADVVIATGTESMSMIPMGGHSFAPNPSLVQHHPDMYLGMGLTAENLVDRHGISREEQDRFALQSHQRALAAEQSGAWNDERIAYPLEHETGVAGDALDRDEGPRADSDAASLSSLQPVFRVGGTVTAGNSSPLTDGAAAVLLVSDAVLREFDLTALGSMVSYAAAGVPPEIMGIGPVAAVPKALAKAGWQLEEIETVELNEAFAAQSLAVIGELGLDESRVNPNGGAIALGHPLGCSGARLVATLLHHMKRNGQKKGLATLCVGGGMGAAATFTAA